MTPERIALYAAARVAVPPYVPLRSWSISPVEFGLAAELRFGKGLRRATVKIRVAYPLHALEMIGAPIALTVQQLLAEISRAERDHYAGEAYAGVLLG